MGDRLGTLVDLAPLCIGYLVYPTFPRHHKGIPFGPVLAVFPPSLTARLL